MKYIDSIRELLALYIGLILLGAICFSYFEDKSLVDGMWWAMVTAMTVGYGDLYPTTFGGKLVGILVMHMSVLFILPLLIGNVCSHCIKNRDTFSHEEQEEMKGDIANIKNALLHVLNILKQREIKEE